MTVDRPLHFLISRGLINGVKAEKLQGVEVAPGPEKVVSWVGGRRRCLGQGVPRVPGK